MDPSNSTFLSTHHKNQSIISTMTPYDINKIKELRKRVSELEQETVSLTRELSLKYEECDTLNEEILKLREELRLHKNANYNLQYNAYVTNLNSNENEQQQNNDGMDFAKLQGKVNEFGEILLSLKMSYENVLKENNDKLKLMSQEYENNLSKLIQENNDLKRRMNTIDKMESKIKSGDLNVKDIYEFTGTTFNANNNNHKINNYIPSSSVLNSNKIINRFDSNNDDKIPPYEDIQTDMNKLREDIQIMDEL